LRPATFVHWSRQESFLHALDPRVKLLLLFAFVVSLAVLRAPSPVQLLTYFAYLLTLALLARLPLVRVFSLSLSVIPFVGVFSVIVYLTGDVSRAWFILVKSYLSATSVLVCVSLTPVSQLVAAARFFRIPALVVEITQLIYRYLFVLGGQARVMQIAFSSRAGRPGRTALRAASGMIAVLFGRSYEKASMVHHSMYSRGFTGTFAVQSFPPFTIVNVCALTAGLLLLTMPHLI